MTAWGGLGDPAPSPRLAPVLAFIGLYTGLAIAVALASGSRVWPMYLGVVATLVPALYLVHAYGFGITTWLCWHILKSALRSPDGRPVRPSPGMLLVCVAAGMGFGALNETVEFITTHLLPENNIGDYENTGWDLVANFVGALIASALIRWGGNPEEGLFSYLLFPNNHLTSQ